LKRQRALLLLCINQSTIHNRCWQPNEVLASIMQFVVVVVVVVVKSCHLASGILSTKVHGVPAAATPNLPPTPFHSITLHDSAGTRVEVLLLRQLLLLFAL